jgi:hypothetical protein
VGWQQVVKKEKENPHNRIQRRCAAQGLNAQVAAAAAGLADIVCEPGPGPAFCAGAGCTGGSGLRRMVPTGQLRVNQADYAERGQPVILLGDKHRDPECGGESAGPCSGCASWGGVAPQ